MKIVRVMLFISTAALLMPLYSQADEEEFHGIIEKIPEGKIGIWDIGGRQFAATATTELKEEDGSLAVGACAEVEYKGDVVKEIESEEPGKCKK